MKEWSETQISALIVGRRKEGKHSTEGRKRTMTMKDRDTKIAERCIPG